MTHHTVITTSTGTFDAPAWFASAPRGKYGELDRRYSLGLRAYAVVGLIEKVARAAYESGIRLKRDAFIEVPE